MTAPTYSPGTVPGTKPSDAVGTEERCPACPHPMSAHDRIGVRFCQATVASSDEGRGCVCRVG
ncbi:RGCVC family protein [Modestobacter versicolor]|uniref:Uncharacterized protein n=1 Tax=Modestobacter versicolor TaxID=429133 RepID=A0A323V3S4_9ACTN|nr:RGCVC family protein [Modestobacter versicolor]MBB3674991.1 hypothetical protein [Modestobacter versicolor]PZA19487.1 hypothetical protein DMO24_20470 [Modestobacter versicolor]